MKDITKKISEFLINENQDFVLIGATARDLFLEKNGINIIGTKDIDFAILIDNWEQFDALKSKLKKEFNLAEDKRIYRLLWGNIPLDFLPFGKIEDGNFSIKWPNTFRERIKVMGFKEACEHAAIFDIDGVKVKAVIPELLIALKLNSWSASGNRVKDATDIKCILENVEVLCRDLKEDTTLNAEILEDKFSTEHEKLIVRLGLHIRRLLGSGQPLDYLENLFDGEESRRILIRHMNNDELPAEEVFKKFNAMILSLKAGIQGK